MKEYPQNTVFPVTLTVYGDLLKYTFAIFGKSGSNVDKRSIYKGASMPETASTVATTPGMSHQLGV